MKNFKKLSMYDENEETTASNSTDHLLGLGIVSESYDYVNPNHYKKGSKEVWEMMVDIWGINKFIAHCEMCAFKYRQRLGLKPDQPIQRDLDKARWYESKADELRTCKEKRKTYT